jgi:hypothetical protein
VGAGMEGSNKDWDKNKDMVKLQDYEEEGISLADYKNMGAFLEIGCNCGFVCNFQDSKLHYVGEDWLNR